jgi:hypothetical protein
MTSESRNSSLLCNGSVNIIPRKRTHATIEEPISKQWIGKHTTIGVLLEMVFSARAEFTLDEKPSVFIRDKPIFSSEDVR